MHEQFLIHAFLHALELCLLTYKMMVQLLYKFHNLLSQIVKAEEYRELSKLRQKATENSTFTIMEGLDEAAKLRKAMGM